MLSPLAFAVGKLRTARAFDTRTLRNGAHRLTALVTLKSGVQMTVAAKFRVAN